MLERFYHLKCIADLLGWRGLRQEQMSAPDSGEPIVWYWTTDRKLFLHINPSPQGQAENYAATVYAERYRIPFTAVGFHPFSVYETAEDAANRLRPILACSDFRNREWRKRFMAPSLTAHKHLSAGLRQPTSSPQREAARQ